MLISLHFFIHFALASYLVLSQNIMSPFRKAWNECQNANRQKEVPFFSNFRDSIRNLNAYIDRLIFFIDVSFQKNKKNTRKLISLPFFLKMSICVPSLKYKEKSMLHIGERGQIRTSSRWRLQTSRLSKHFDFGRVSQKCCPWAMILGKEREFSRLILMIFSKKYSSKVLFPCCLHSIPKAQQKHQVHSPRSSRHIIRNGG